MRPWAHQRSPDRQHIEEGPEEKSKAGPDCSTSTAQDISAIFQDKKKFKPANNFLDPVCHIVAIKECLTDFRTRTQ
jgi:hypothetical protein